jgi:hypothetical protein
VFRGLATSARKLIRVSLADDSDVNIFTPFGVARGSIFSSPTYNPIRGIVVSFDAANGLLGGPLQPGRAVCIAVAEALRHFDATRIVLGHRRAGCQRLPTRPRQRGDLSPRVRRRNIACCNGFENRQRHVLVRRWNRDVIYCSVGSLARVWAER